MARPSKFTKALVDKICERIASGESLRAICEGKSMPAKTTVMRWLADKRYSEFCDQYAHAREAQADHFADEILAIADDGSNDTYTTEDGREIVDHDHIQRSRLRVDTRKWLMVRMAPKKYGDKLELTGKDGGPIDYRNMTESEVDRRLAELEAKAGNAGHKNRHKELA